MWDATTFQRLATTLEIDIAAYRHDGTLTKPVTIWVVPVVDGLYVRSWRGTAGAWYRATQQTLTGRIWLGDANYAVRFVPIADVLVNDAIDAGYRSKYRTMMQYVSPMIGADARATTLQLVTETHKE